MDMLKRLLASRKFVVAILTALVVVFNKKLGIGLSEVDLQSVVTIIAAAILGEGAIDAARAFRAPPVETEESKPSTPVASTPTDIGDKKP